MVDYDVIVGGVGVIDAETLTHGGQEMIVGGAAKCASRDKLLHLKHAPDDTKKLLAIIGMSRPVVFGKIHYDDGDKKKLRTGPRMDMPNDALLEMLQTRLSLSADAVVKQLVYDCKLSEPVFWALTELIQVLLKRIKKKRPNMRAIKVNGDIGEILDRVRKGDEYFKVATDHKDWPKNMTAVTQELLNILKREHVPMSNWKEPSLTSPKWPSMCSKNEDAMKAISNKKYKTVRQYIEAIVLREHILMEHMDAVEKYYVESARDIQKYKTALQSFLGTLKSEPCKTKITSFVVKKEMGKTRRTQQINRYHL